jgi:endopeptidase Clp ATP-binding regulatory subunit ClpX
MAESSIARCSFCNRPRNEVKALISAGDDGPHICNRCLDQGHKAFTASQKKEQAEREKEAPLRKPNEIKTGLDERVIAQDKAKIDLAIAVYNHYRRREAIRQGVDLGDVEIQKSNILLMGPSGCHRKGQKVLMHDGTLLAVEDVQVGDRLMGPDSTPRTVLELHRGTEEMVEITPTKGEPWVVNKGHILTLVRTSHTIGARPGRPKKYTPTNEVKDVWVSEYLNWSRTQKSIHKLFRAAVDFTPAEQLPLEPYFLGVLLGDGCLRNRVAVTNEDQQVVKEVYVQAGNFGLRVNIEAEGTSSATYHLSGPHGGGDGKGPKLNPITTILRSLDLFGCDSETKFIPHVYKTASREDRLELLAGLIDTDGDYSGKDNCHYYTSKSPALANDLAFVARSLGFAAYVSPCRKRDQNGTEGIYHRTTISGDVDQIPVRVEYKRARSRRQVKNVLRVGFKTRELPPEEYFGFVLDGDHRYLLDDFTVTHNTGKTELARSIAKQLNVPFYVGDATRLTQAGYVGDDVESLIQGLIADAGGDLERAQWGICFIDEFDKLARKSGRTGSGYRDVGGEGVQQSILKMLEGASMSIPRGMGMRMGQGGATDTCDTGNILFICAGSFAGIEEIIDRRINANSHKVGFGTSERKKLTKTDIYLAVTEEDVLEFGLIPELLGRLPVLTTTLALTEDNMIRILTEPKNAIIKQFQALFKLDGIDLQFDEAALKGIAAEATKRPTGARALRSIVEDILRDYSYESRSQADIKAIRITEDVVTKKGQAKIVRREPKKAVAATG